MLRSEIREAVLARYYKKCMLKHAFSFFEWRRRRSKIRFRRCVELLVNLRKNDHFMDETKRQKLLTFGVAGLAQIEEIKVLHENRPPIEKLADVDLRGVIVTSFHEDDALPSQLDA
jgi:hypothetical protein